MPRMIGTGLSRREREILDVLHRSDEASVADVLAEMPEAPSYSAVRTILRILERKGHVTHIEYGKRYVYRATEPRMKAARSALRQVVETFFSGSLERAVTAMLSDDDVKISNADLAGLADAIDAARDHDAGIPDVVDCGWDGAGGG